MLAQEALKPSVLILVALLGCLSAGPITAAEPSVPELQRMRVTMVPTVREVRVLRSVSYEAPTGGVRLNKNAAFTLPVTVSGTANLPGSAWLERDGAIIAKTPLKYDAQADLYRADILLASDRIGKGDYVVTGALESLDPITDPRPLHVDIESSIPGGLVAEVESFRVSFDTDAHTLNDDERSALQALALRLQPYAAAIRDIQIEGHCDTRGSEIHNRDLGLNRAASVMKILGANLPDVSMGVASLGAEDPDPAGDTDTDWARNRWGRIRITLK